jgi:hypothetical protein
MGTYRVCVWSSTAATGTPLLGHSGTTPYTVAAAAPNLSTPAGPATGAGTITATGLGPYLASATTVGVTFGTGTTCPATYTTTGAIAATATKNPANTIATITVPNTLTAPTAYRVCLYAGTANTSALIGDAGTFSALPTVTVSPAGGPAGGTNTITVSSTANFLSGVTTLGATFSRTACPSTYSTTGGNLAVTSPLRISATKAAMTVPTGVDLTGSETTATYYVCLYNGAVAGDSTLVAVPATYSISPALSITAVSPLSGPSQGGTVVEITGGGFPVGGTADALTVSLGGSPLTDVRVLSPSRLTGVTTAHTPGNATVTVTTAAGSVNHAAAFVYSYGITVAPNTAPAGTASVYLDIMGVGFSTMNFTTTGPTSGGHVFLVEDEYVSAGTGATWTTPPVAECTGIIKVSDREIICELDLTDTLTATGGDAGAPVDEGTYTVTVVSNATPGAPGVVSSIISSGSTFTVAPY